jgi:hypothetical protein
MPPKPKQQADRWGNEHKEAILAYFKSGEWDPLETSGPKINKLLKAASKETLKLIGPHFSVNDGGTKTNNNTLYQHYKDIGCEFIVERTRAGFRRKGGAFSLVVLFCRRLAGTKQTTHSPILSFPQRSTLKRKV